jgi:hypothetical protein
MEGVWDDSMEVSMGKLPDSDVSSLDTSPLTPMRAAYLDSPLRAVWYTRSPRSVEDVIEGDDEEGWAGGCMSSMR